MGSAHGPLVVLREGESRAPLICFHPTGGHLNEYSRLSVLLESESVYGIRSRARVDASVEHATIDEMAVDYAAIVSGAHTGPYRLFGWSLGATIAHAVACVLEQQGCEVALVGMVDPLVGGTPPAKSDDLSLGITMAAQIFNPAPLPAGALRRALARVGEIGEDPKKVVPWCHDNGLISTEGVDADEFLATVLLLPRHRSLLLAHRPGLCRAKLVIWRADELFRRDAYDWSVHTRAGVAERKAGGSHYTIMRSPHVDRIARDLRELDPLAMAPEAVR